MKAELNKGERRRLSILGSTGSVGSNTLRLVEENQEAFEVVSLSCGSSVEILLGQIEKYQPQYCSVATDQAASELQKALQKKGLSLKQIFVGDLGHRRCIEESRPDVLISAMMGCYGLQATISAITLETPVVGIANKEILVMAGPFIRQALRTSSSQLVPVDSEHSAIFQCLMGNQRADLKKIFLTASGGPFRSWPKSDFHKIKLKDALQHPNWVMGQKITVDSASMMNKGLEYIEAIRLFDLQASQIEVLVHPQSVIHSMVEFVDHSVMAQLGVSDMRIPISLALAFPNRLPYNLQNTIDFKALGSLSFEAPDLDKFPCLRLSMEAESIGPQGSVIINSANEQLVAFFLKEKISFLDIPKGIEEALEVFKSESVPSLEDVLDLDFRVKEWIQSSFASLGARAGGVS